MTGRCRAIIFAWPDGTMDPSIDAWLWRHRARILDRRMVCQSPYRAALNHAIDDLALGGPADDYLFIEHDLVLGPETDEFWNAQADIVYVCYNRGAAERARPGDFHLGMWRTTRRVLEGLKRPIFGHERPHVCRDLRRAAAKAGLRVVAAGWAGHGGPCRLTQRHLEPACQQGTVGQRAPL